MTVLKLRLISLTVLCLFICTSLLAQVNVTGNVTDEQDNPVSGVTVTVLGGFGTATTDASGNFAISGMRPNSIYLVKTSKTGYQTVVRTMETDLSGFVDDYTMVLSDSFVSSLESGFGITQQAGLAVVAGEVADLSENPVANATVSLVDSSGSAVGQMRYLDASMQPDQALTQTSTSGIFIAFNVPTGWVHVSATHASKTFTQSVVVTYADMVSMDDFQEATGTYNLGLVPRDPFVSSCGDGTISLLGTSWSGATSACSAVNMNNIPYDSVNLGRAVASGSDFRASEEWVMELTGSNFPVLSTETQSDLSAASMSFSAGTGDIMFTMTDSEGNPIQYMGGKLKDENGTEVSFSGKANQNWGGGSGQWQPTSSPQTGAFGNLALGDITPGVYFLYCSTGSWPTFPVVITADTTFWITTMSPYSQAHVAHECGASYPSHCYWDGTAAERVVWTGVLDNLSSTETAVLTSVYMLTVTPTWGNLTGLHLYNDLNGNCALDTGEPELATISSPSSASLFTLSSSMNIGPSSQVNILVVADFAGAPQAGDYVQMEPVSVLGHTQSNARTVFNSRWCSPHSVPVETSPNQKPDQPVNVSPANNATGVATSGCTLTASAYSDPEGDPHTASRWTLQDSEYNITWTSNVDTVNLTSVTVPVTLVGNETYRWLVSYEDDHGNWSTNSNATFFTTAAGGNSPPNTPTNVSPADSATGVSSTSITYTISAYSDPNGDAGLQQWCQVTDNPGDYSSPLIYIGSLPSGSFHDTTVLELGHTYGWRARYQDINGALSAWSTETTFTTENDTTVPSTPSITSAAASDTTIGLFWTASSDAESGIDHYTIYGGSGGSVTASGTSNYTQLTGQTPGTEYGITVTATNGAGLESNASNEECLTTTSTSLVPLTPCSLTQVYPDSGAVNFTFTDGGDTRWRIDVYSDVSLTTKVTSSKTRTHKWLSSTSWSPNDKKWGKILNGGATSGVVYWQVTGKLGGVSPSRTLYVAPAAAAIPQTPSNGGSTPDSTPATFTWDLNHNKKVQVEFSSTSDFSSGVEVSSKKNKPGKKWIKGETWTAPDGKWDKIVALGSTVYWRVYGKDALGRETWSTIYTLHITT